MNPSFFLGFTVFYIAQKYEDFAAPLSAPRFRLREPGRRVCFGIRGTTIIYVNVLYQDLTTELGWLCHDFCCSDPEKIHFPELKQAVTDIKNTPEGEKRMGSMIAKLQSEAEERGEKRGREEGRRETNRENVVRMLGLGKTLEDIAESLALPQEEVRLMAEQLRGA